MGMFDDLRCEYPLPNPAHNKLKFQTKDLENILDLYVITAEGRLMHEAYEAEWVEEDPATVAEKRAAGKFCLGGHIKRDNGRMEDTNYHGFVTFYENIQGKTHAEDEWVQYKAKFTDGKVVEIVREHPAWVEECKKQTEPQ